MAPFLIWKGVKHTILGDEIKFVEDIEFEGEVLGAHFEEHNARGEQTTFYRDLEGRVVVHRVRWSRWENEPTVAEVFVFASLEEAKTTFRWELEQAGLIQPRTVSLDEIDNQ